MTSQNIMTERREQLKEIIKGSIETVPAHSKGFAVRINEMRKGQKILPDKYKAERMSQRYVSSKYMIHYGGFPYTACLGFAMAGTPLAQISQEMVDTFIEGLRRLQGRSGESLDDLASDDMAILGLADGVFKLLKMDEERLQDAKRWLLAIVKSKDLSNNIWSNRLRLLAGDLLDGLGRLRKPMKQNDVDGLALELSIRPVWAEQFRHASYPNHKVCQNLLKDLLTRPAPTVGDLDRAMIWLIALEKLIAETGKKRGDKTEETIRILENTGTFL